MCSLDTRTGDDILIHSTTFKGQEKFYDSKLRLGNDHSNGFFWLQEPRDIVLWGQPFNEVHPNVFPQSFKCIINQAERSEDREKVKVFKWASEGKQKTLLKLSIEKTGPTFHQSL